VLRIIASSLLRNAVKKNEAQFFSFGRFQCELIRPDRGLNPFLPSFLIESDTHMEEEPILQPYEYHSLLRLERRKGSINLMGCGIQKKQAFTMFYSLLSGRNRP
jgi:hypothetical protein